MITPESVMIFDDEVHMDTFDVVNHNYEELKSVFDSVVKNKECES